MSTFCLDTSAVEPITTGRHPLTAGIRGWFDQHERHCYISAITPFELAFGTFRLSMRKSVDDRMRAQKISTINKFFLLKMADRTIAIDEDILDRAAELRTTAERSYRDIGACDAIIAATADLSGHVLVTLNLRDLSATGIECIDAVELVRKHSVPALNAGTEQHAPELPHRWCTVVPRQREVDRVAFNGPRPIPVVIAIPN